MNYEPKIAKLAETKDKNGFDGIKHSLYYEIFNIFPSISYFNNFNKEVLKHLLDSEFEIFTKTLTYIDSNQFQGGHYLINKNSQLIIACSPSFWGTELKSYNLVLLFNKDLTSDEKVAELYNSLSDFKYAEKENSSNIYAINHDGQKFEKILLDFDINLVDIEKYYNDDLYPIYEKIKDKLVSKKSGLVLFHGIMGSGKTSFIKQLAKTIKEKRFLFIPTNLTESITNPSFIGFLMNQKDSIIILEDAENILKKRELTSGTSQSVSNILNLSDGILGDGLNLKIIATFNSDVKLLDDALLRKGRLIAEYEFKELAANKCNKVFEEMGIDYRTSKDMTLAEVFNIGDTIGIHKKDEKKSIGF